MNRFYSSANNILKFLIRIVKDQKNANIFTLTAWAPVVISKQHNGCSKVKYSKHAKRRSQQRGIPDRIIELMLAHGDRESAGKGSTICCIRSRLTRSELIREAAFEGLTGIDRYLCVYLVIAQDNTIVTVGHRFNRVMTNFSRVRSKKIVH
jgi:hypothetical protein